MLGLRFNLTPAQTEMLLVIANECYRTSADERIVLPDYESSYFVPTVDKLIAKGLVTHERDRSPTFQPTEEGIAVASLIEKQCESLLKYRDRQRTVRVDGRKRLKKLDSFCEQR